MSLLGKNYAISPSLLADKGQREIAEITRRSIQSSPFLNFEGKLFHLNNDSSSSEDMIIPHGLSFRPLDAMIVSSNSSSVLFYFEEFTDETIKVYLGSGEWVRFLVGTFRG